MAANSVGSQGPWRRKRLPVPIRKMIFLPLVRYLAPAQWPCHAPVKKSPLGIVLDELKAWNVYCKPLSKTTTPILTHFPFFGILISLCGFPIIQAVAQSNQTSPLGINLSGVTYYSPEQPFLNVLKTAAGWAGRNATPNSAPTDAVDVDAAGWVRSLSVAGSPGSTFARVDTLVLRELGKGQTSAPYPGGRYVVLYEGEGTLIYGYDAVKNSSLSTPGRDVLDVTPSNGGIYIAITATDPRKTGNYIRNIRIVQQSNETPLASGEIFNPDFVGRILQFRSLRFMDWMQTNASTEGAAWSTRATPNSAFWAAPVAGTAPQASGTRSVPVEVMLALSNKVAADPWFNLPHLATDDYITQFASLVYQRLASDRKVYVEFSNEMWNWAFPQLRYAIAQGKLTWPAVSDTDYAFGMSWYAKRTSEMCDIWKSVWGTEAPRVVCVLGTQAASSDLSDYLLNPTRNLYGRPSVNINTLAIAPYFGGRGVPSSWTSEPDGGLSKLFTEIMQGGLDPSGPPGGLIKQAIDWVVASKSVADKYGLNIIAYEGGPHLVNPNDLALTNLYVAANRDPRMGTAIATYLQKWRAAGGNLLSYFSDIGSYTKWGSWGALENVMQTNSPKYDALMNFITANPCWWNGCTGRPPAATHDADGDGISDIFWRDSSGSTAVWLMRSAGAIGPTGSYGVVPTTWSIVGQRDFNSDGKYDVLWRDSSTGTVALWLLNGLEVAQTHTFGAVAANWAIVGTGDFDGDRASDILWRDTNTGAISIWTINPVTLGVMSSYSLGAVAGNWVIAGVADFNGDGKADILWRDNNTGAVVIWMLDFGGGTLQVSQSGTLGAVPGNWVITGTGDFNGDGNHDILWCDRNTGTVAVWLLKGLQLLQSGNLGAVLSNWAVAQTGDFNGDGRGDILWRDAKTGAVAIWFMNGSQVTQSASLGTVPLSWTIQVLNAD
jgi:FG-GAP-like repeat